MTDVVVQPGTTAPVLGLLVTSFQPISLRSELDGSITAFGSDVNDLIAAATSSDLTRFSLLGAGGNDTLTGAAATDIISGGTGNDTISGGLGDDTLTGGEGADIIAGETGNDFLQGDVGNDRLDGGADDDRVSGGAGNDIVAGGAGNDVVNGGRGRDRLTGNAGDDVFVFDPNTAGRRPAQRDRIVDFTPNDDQIQISRRIVPNTGLRRGQLRPGDFASVQRLSPQVRAKIVYERSTGLVYFNPARGADIALFQVQKNLPITAADFEIF